MGKLTLTIPELARVMGISVSHGYALAHENLLPVRVIKLGRRMVVSKREVEDLLGPIAETSPAGYRVA